VAALDLTRRHRRAAQRCLYPKLRVRRPEPAQTALYLLGDSLSRLAWIQANVQLQLARVRHRRGDPTAADDGFPRVCAILQVASEGPFLDTFLYGSPMLGMMPTLLDPRELLDGAVTSGTYDWAGVRNPTFLYQRNGLVRELLTSDGQRLRFAGLILALGYLDSGFEKQRSAMLAGGLALQLGADGAVCTTFGSGNSHTDTMLTVRACERLGIRTVAIVAETNGGLTDHVPEADVIVSTGNEDELVPGWEPAEIVGGATGVAAGSPVPAALYLGSVSEMGDLAWTAVPA